MQSQARIQAAWDFEDHGPSVVWVGPGVTTYALGEFAWNAVRPPAEPRHQWFRGYAGPYRSLSEVAILCHRERATNVTRLQSVGGPLLPGRHQRWHFPECLEVTPGQYLLEVHYYARATEETARELATRTAESTRPSVVEWEAEAGGLYELVPRVGEARPAPENAGSFLTAPPRPGTPGTTAQRLEVSSWSAGIERVESPEAFGAPVLGYREDWRRYEEAGTTPP